MSNRKFDQSMIDWTVRPKLEDERFIPIYSAQPLVTLSVHVVSHKLTTVATHYFHARTIPCVGEANECAGCKCGQGKRVKGYLGAFEPAFSRLCILELTHEGMRTCNVDLFNDNIDLRGFIASVKRIGKGRNGAMRCEMGGLQQLQGLPESFDVRAVLCRIWSGQMRQK